jgi:uncharacterized protein (TIGR00369 family)
VVLLQEPVRGVFSYLEYPGLATLSGLEQTRLFAHGSVPTGPLWYLTGLEITEFGIGTATFRMPCTGWWRSPAGVVPGGLLALAADAALATAIHTALGPRRVPTTSDLMLNFVRPASAHRSVIVRAQQVHQGRAQGLAEATVEDSDGRLLARASTRCVIVDIPGPLPDPPVAPLPAPAYDGPHPFQRAPEGAPLPQEVWDTHTGLELLQQWRAGTLTRSPLSNLLGAQVEYAEDGRVTCTIPASEWFCGMQGAFYGGALSLFADYAMLGAVQSTQPPGNAWATLDLNVRFVRHLTPKGPPIRALARVVHRGRRLIVAACELHQGDHGPAVLADSSVMLLSNRPWADVDLLTDESHRDPPVRAPTS